MNDKIHSYFSIDFENTRMEAEEVNKRKLMMVYYAGLKKNNHSIVKCNSSGNRKIVLNNSV